MYDTSQIEKENLKEFDGLDKFETLIVRVEEREKEKRELETETEDLREILGKYNSVKKELDAIKYDPEDEKKVKELLKTAEELNKLITDTDDLEDLFKKFSQISKDLKEGELRLDKLKKDEQNIFSTMNVCPICLQIIERWKFIKGYEGLYEVSDFGNMRTYYSKNGKNILEIPIPKSQFVDKDGYKKVYLYAKEREGAESKAKFVHKVVLETFFGECPEGMETSHLDGDCANNQLYNLVWESHADNNNRKKEHGTNYYETSQIVQYSLETGKEISSFQSIKEASRKTGIGIDSIWGCCIGAYKKGGGYVWKRFEKKTTSKR